VGVDSLGRFAAELSRVPVDVISAGNAPSTRAAMLATRVIPIITVSADPVGDLPVEQATKFELVINRASRES
jgi:hypothetical protein